MFSTIPATPLLARPLLALGCLAAVATAADVATTAFPIADGSLSLEAPEGFERVQPKSNMIEVEFAVPSEGDLPAGRMTVMGAGGAIEANIDRWCGQFTQPDGGLTKDKLTKKSLKVAGCTVTLVGLSGTYLDQPAGPMAGGPTVKRPGYRMLAAIVETPTNAEGESIKGNYFLKFYGPAETVERHAAGFQKMIEGMVPAGR